MLSYFQDKILDILVNTILILYRKLYRNIVSITYCLEYWGKIILLYRAATTVAVQGYPNGI